MLINFVYISNNFLYNLCQLFNQILNIFVHIRDKIYLSYDNAVYIIMFFTINTTFLKIYMLRVNNKVKDNNNSSNKQEKTNLSIEASRINKAAHIINYQDHKKPINIMPEDSKKLDILNQHNNIVNKQQYINYLSAKTDFLPFSAQLPDSDD